MKFSGLKSAFNSAIDFLLRFTFPIRRSLLRATLVMGTIAVFIFEMPIALRMVFAYAFIIIVGAGLYSVANSFARSIGALVSITILRKKYQITEYTTPQVEQLKKDMGLGNVKVMLTSNPHAWSPFTNVISRTVYLTTEWLKDFPAKEVLSTLGHEFGHVKTRRRFALETIAVMGAVFAFSTLLSFHSIPLVVELVEFAGMILGLTYVSWRNERRADMISAQYCGPEGLISVFEQILSKTKRDEGSETHPPLRDRIARLSCFLDSHQVRSI